MLIYFDSTKFVVKAGTAKVHYYSNHSIETTHTYTHTYALESEMTKVQTYTDIDTRLTKSDLIRSKIEWH